MCLKKTERARSLYARSDPVGRLIQLSSREFVPARIIPAAPCGQSGARNTKLGFAAATGSKGSRPADIRAS